MTTIPSLATRYGDDDEERAALLERTTARLASLRRNGGKVCSRCDVRRPVADFGPDARRQDGLRSACRSCEATDVRRRAGL